MSAVNKLLSLVVLFCVCILPALPQQQTSHCDQFTITPEGDEDVDLGDGVNLIIPQGGSKHLTCQHNMVGAIGADWYRDTTIIQSDIDGGLVDCSCLRPAAPITQAYVELEFTNFDGAASADEYSCRVATRISGVFNICRFDVKVAEPPTISPMNLQTTYEVSRDTNFVVNLNASGLPFPSITWKNRTTELVNGSRVTVGVNGSLTVNSLKSYDRGNYSLNLTNSAETTITQFSLFVLFAEIVQISEVERVGNDFMITCEAIGYPSVVIEWLDSSGNVITADQTVIPTPGVFEQSVRNILTVRDGNCQDPYVCRACNGECSSAIRTSRSVRICIPGPGMGPPQPMNVMVTQNGRDSVHVEWTVEDANVDDQFDVCYSLPSSSSPTCLGPLLDSTTLSTTVGSLEVGQEYTFIVTRYRDGMGTDSDPRVFTVEPCTAEVQNVVYGVSIDTTVNRQGERTFMISWAEPTEEVVTGYKVMTDQGWGKVVRQKIITTIITPGNFCNGDEHTFVVMAMNNCAREGPPSGKVIGNCDTITRVRISSVRNYGTAVGIQWALKSMDDNIKPPLRITVVELNPNGAGQVLRLNYSIDSVADGAECLGGLKTNTDYKICLHPVYTDDTAEAGPVCVDVKTAEIDVPDVTSSCTVPATTDFLGSVSQTIALPDYAIALIVVGALIIVAVVFCLIGICFACNNNNKNSDIDDLGSDYSSSIATGMQGRMSTNHNRNMSPTRSCLSYHSKGHSTNWNDHMGTLREMETEVGTNV